jgi:hypothetical protein
MNGPFLRTLPALYLAFIEARQIQRYITVVVKREVGQIWKAGQRGPNFELARQMQEHRLISIGRKARGEGLGGLHSPKHREQIENASKY